MRKALAVVPVILMAVVVAGCGQNRAVVVGKTTSTQAPRRSAGTTAGSNKAMAQAEAKRLLGSVTMPPGSVRLTGVPSSVLSGPVMGAPATESLVDDTAFWKVPTSMGATLAWFAANHPGGLPQSGEASSSSHGTTTTSGFSYDAPSSAAWTGASVQIGVAPTGSGTSVVRADGIALWIDPVPLPDGQTGPVMRITLASGCPASDRGFTDVANPPPPLDSSLLPSEPPVGGLACQYYGLNGDSFTLKQKTVMDSAAASAFSSGVGQLQVGHLDGQGATSCPADDGSVAVVALDYTDGKTVDLWMAPTGCAYVSNGYIRASGSV
jgi:hypothetical protein